MLKFIEDFWYQADGDDFYPAIRRALESTGTPAVPTGFSLYFDNKTYRFSQTIPLIRAMSLIGSGAAGRWAGTTFLFPKGVPGLICGYDRTNTVGSGEWSIVERIKFEGDDGGGDTDTAHGITLKARMTIRDCYIASFTGDGIHIEASTPDANANNWIISNVRIQDCGGDGLFVLGSDANAGCATELDSSNNQGWGIREVSSLGNTYIACHCAENQAGAYTTRDATTGISRRGERSLFLNCYEEGGQASQVDHPAIALGGSLNLTADSTCVQLTSQFGKALFDNGVLANNRQSPSVLGAMGPDPGVALAFADDSPWPYRLHGPSPDAQWWELKWAESVAPLRFSMERPSDTAPPVSGGQVWMEQGFLVGSSDARIRVFSGRGKPTTGTFLKGDRMMVDDPVVGDYAGWICIASGGPGTWAPFGKIDPDPEPDSLGNEQELRKQHILLDMNKIEGKMTDFSSEAQG